MKKESVLEIALQVLKERQKTHGDPQDNMATIALLWTAYLGIQIHSEDVCVLNMLQKISRLKASNHPDNPVDLAGYAAILGEVMGQE